MQETFSFRRLTGDDTVPKDDVDTIIAVRRRGGYEHLQILQQGKAWRPGSEPVHVESCVIRSGVRPELVGGTLFLRGYDSACDWDVMILEECDQSRRLLCSLIDAARAYNLTAAIRGVGQLKIVEVLVERPLIRDDGPKLLADILFSGVVGPLPPVAKLGPPATTPTSVAQSDLDLAIRQRDSARVEADRLRGGHYDRKRLLKLTPIPGYVRAFDTNDEWTKDHLIEIDGSIRHLIVVKCDRGVRVDDVKNAPRDLGRSAPIVVYVPDGFEITVVEIDR